MIGFDNDDFSITPPVPIPPPAPRPSTVIPHKPSSLAKLPEPPKKETPLSDSSSSSSSSDSSDSDSDAEKIPVPPRNGKI